LKNETQHYMIAKVIMKTINIMINGLPGRLARIIARAALADQRFKVIPYSLTGENTEEKTIALEKHTIELIKPQFRAKKTEQIQSEFPFFIAIDYTHPSAVNFNAEYYVKHEIPFVMGTTGGDRKKLEQTVNSASPLSSWAAVIAPNMARQIVGLQAMMEYAAHTFPGLFKEYSLEVKESHQHGKADTSGTAKAMIGYFNKLGLDYNVNDIQMIRDPEIQEKNLGVPKEHLGGHGWHTYTLKSQDGSALFEFKHNVNGRDIYVEGSFDAIIFLKEKLDLPKRDKKLYTMIDVLGGNSKRSDDQLRQQIRHLEKLSITDELTGLYNSRHFFSQIKTEIKRSKRYSRALSLLMLDLNNFKHYNDSWGHLEGDKVLKSLGCLISSCTRSMDTAYRYGGDEFAILLPETTLQHACTISTRIKDNLSSLSFTPKPGMIVSISACIGAAELIKGEDFQSFIQRADEALYKSKNCRGY
jgi:4-hydroxy-tetrahydrodipicolinate reductase